MKRSPDGPEGFENISNLEELKAFLPPGSQISPGKDGGTNIFIPYPAGYSAQMPNYRGPWAKFRREIFRFDAVAACEGATQLPRAKTPPKGMNALCDQWIEDYYQDKNRSKRPVPKEIAPWLMARSMVAGMFVAFQDTHDYPVPEMELEEFMCAVLIGYWNNGGQDDWYGIHPDASAHSE